jgi:hypothetical protein
MLAPRRAPNPVHPALPVPFCRAGLAFVNRAIEPVADPATRLLRSFVTTAKKSVPAARFERWTN